LILKRRSVFRCKKLCLSGKSQGQTFGKRQHCSGMPLQLLQGQGGFEFSCCADLVVGGECIA